MRCECKWVNVWVPMIWKLSGKGKLFLWKWKLSWKCRERWLMTFLLFSLCPTCLPITSPAQNCLQFELTKICFVCPPWFYDLWSDLIFFSGFPDLLHRLGLFLHANTTGGTANLDFNFRFYKYKFHLKVIRVDAGSAVVISTRISLQKCFELILRFTFLNMLTS